MIEIWQIQSRKSGLFCFKKADKCAVLTTGNVRVSSEMKLLDGRFEGGCEWSVLAETMFARFQALIRLSVRCIQHEGDQSERGLLENMTKSNENEKSMEMDEWILRSRNERFSFLKFNKQSCRSKGGKGQEKGVRAQYLDTNETGFSLVEVIWSENRTIGWKHYKKRK